MISLVLTKQKLVLELYKASRAVNVYVKPIVQKVCWLFKLVHLVLFLPFCCFFPFLSLGFLFSFSIKLLFVWFLYAMSSYLAQEMYCRISAESL